MKLVNIYLFILVLFFNSCSCQNQNDSINHIPLKIKNLYHSYPLLIPNGVSLLGGHYNVRTIFDSTYIIQLSNKQNALYIRNETSNRFDTLFFDSIPTFLISKIYYHNQDSIFIFYNRKKIKDYEYQHNINILYDFVLVNRNGKVVNWYLLDSVPYIYNGYLSPMIYVNENSVSNNLIINNKLLINFTNYKPFSHDSNFIKFNPKLLCLYDLTTKEIKMLNVKFPPEDIGKKYPNGCSTSYFDFTYDKDNNLLISFPYTSKIYKYYFDKDTMILASEKMGFFNNLDSTTILKNQIGDLIQLRFYAPHYCKKNNQYIRDLTITKFKNYHLVSVIELLDSNLNHIGYFFPDSTFNFITYKDDKLMAIKFNNNLKNYYFFDTNPTIRLSFNEFETKILSNSFPF